MFGFYLSGGGGSHVEVFHKKEAQYSDLNQINHFCLEVENIDTVIRSKGMDVTPKKYACDDTFQAWIRDPNDVRIELFNTPPKARNFEAAIAFPTGNQGPLGCGIFGDDRS